VVFKEGDCVRPKDPGAAFDLQDYYRHGKKTYENDFDRFLEHLTLLVNCVYWDDRYPRLVTLDAVRRLWGDGKQPGLRVIGDISCDPGGSIECTVDATDPGDPVYVYLPETGGTVKGFMGHGPVIMAVDILPTEIPRESSAYFSGVFRGMVEPLARADYSAPFEALALPPELKRAVILYRGRLTPDYDYIQKFLSS
jgi:alpha-aminoadipic semialdehyde synthase